jgi:hypothetical protein
MQVTASLRRRLLPSPLPRRAIGNQLKARYIMCAVGLVWFSQVVRAAESGQWVAFDPAFPQHFVDARSIVRVKKDVVRYWDRTGAFPNGDGPDSKYPTYSLLEMNCETHMTRSIRMDSALEAGVDAKATRARAKFLEMIAKIPISYPTDWESLEPSPHEYALLEFVCRPRN